MVFEAQMLVEHPRELNGSRTQDRGASRLGIGRPAERWGHGQRRICFQKTWGAVTGLLDLATWRSLAT